MIDVTDAFGSGRDGEPAGPLSVAFLEVLARNRRHASDLTQRSRQAVLEARATCLAVERRRARRTARVEPPVVEDDTSTTVVAFLNHDETAADPDTTMDGDWRVLLAPDVVDGVDAVALVRDAFADDGDVLIDLRTTSLITSNGARALYDIHRHAEITGHVAALLGPAGIVRTVLEVTGLTGVIPAQMPEDRTGDLPDVLD